MTTQQIANRLLELLKQGQFENAQRELFAKDAISTEPVSSGQPQVKGLDAIIEKGAQFRNIVEQYHSLAASDVITSSNYIALALKVELTMKAQGRIAMDEIIVYQVKDGKIIDERFFY
jgi:ketosteroid isomerase-like protein